MAKLPAGGFLVKPEIDKELRDKLVPILMEHMGKTGSGQQCHDIAATLFFLAATAWQQFNPPPQLDKRALARTTFLHIADKVFRAVAPKN